MMIQLTTIQNKITMNKPTHIVTVSVRIPIEEHEEVSHVVESVKESLQIPDEQVSFKVEAVRGEIREAPCDLDFYAIRANACPYGDVLHRDTIYCKNKNCTSK